jgi:hypothetical protein
MRRTVAGSTAHSLRLPYEIGRRFIVGDLHPGVQFHETIYGRLHSHLAAFLTDEDCLDVVDFSFNSRPIFVGDLAHVLGKALSVVLNLSEQCGRPKLQSPQSFFISLSACGMASRVSRIGRISRKIAELGNKVKHQGALLRGSQGTWNVAWNHLSEKREGLKARVSPFSRILFATIEMGSPGMRASCNRTGGSFRAMQVKPRR